MRESIGSDAVLFTCSAFSSAIEQAASLASIPVLKPNEAMFEAAIRQGGRTAMLYTFPPARAGMEQEFREEADRINPSATLTSFLVEGAIEAVRAGDVAHTQSTYCGGRREARWFRCHHARTFFDSACEVCGRGHDNNTGFNKP